MSGEKGPFDFSATLSHWDISSVSAINYRRGASEMDGLRNWQGSAARIGIFRPKDGSSSTSDGSIALYKFEGSMEVNPADVLGAGSSKQSVHLFGKLFQPITNWWTTKLTAARATENLTTDPGTFFPRYCHRQPVCLFNFSRIFGRTAIASNGKIIFKLPSHYL